MFAPDAAGIDAAARCIASGGIVAFPTETVYGLGADACSGAAVARLYAAKGRPSFNPLIAHVADQSAAAALCDFGVDAQCLARAFWPGPLSLVLPMKARPDGTDPVSPLVTAGLATLAVRVPAHPVAQALLRATGRPVAAPSANPSGRISPTTAAHVVTGLAGRIDGILDGGATLVGVESTIIDCSGDSALLLRAGGITVEAIEAALGRPLAVAKPDSMGVRPRTSPGQLNSHYAPLGSVRLNATSVEEDETLLGFGPVGGAVNLSPTGDLIEAAASLFACLHRLDAMRALRIAVSPIPDQGLGRAINDRLRRAAAPRG